MVVYFPKMKCHQNKNNACLLISLGVVLAACVNNPIGPIGTIWVLSPILLISARAIGQVVVRELEAWRV